MHLYVLSNHFTNPNVQFVNCFKDHLFNNFYNKIVSFLKFCLMKTEGVNHYVE